MVTFKTFVFGICVLALSLSLLACAGPGSSAKTTSAGSPASSAAKPPGPFVLGGEIDGSSGKVVMQGTDTMKFTPNSITKVKPNGAVEVELTNVGATVHNIVGPGLGLPTAVKANPRQKVTATLKAPATAGTYPFWCNEPGHAEAGMTGQIVVSE